MEKKVKICGVTYDLVGVPENFNGGYCGEIDYRKQEIKVNNDMSEEVTKETIIHEMVHGIFYHIGRNDLADDEVLIQTLANGIFNSSFELVEGDKK